MANGPGINWFGQERQPQTRERPEGWTYQEFPEHPREWMQEMLAEQRQTQASLTRAARYARWLCILMAVIAILMFLDYLDHHAVTGG